MRDTELFQAALGLSSPWIVLRSEFDRERKQLDLHIGFARGSRFACPACGAEGCGVHDVKEKEWRHLNFFQHKTVLKASIPRVSCDKCGVKGTRYLWLKNLQNLDAEEKASIVRLEAANLDTMQAWQIRMNLQDVFTMPSVASARKFLHRWHAWVSTCDLQPMKKVAATIMAKADEILRSISSNPSNGLLEAINGNVQAAKRKAKGYRTKHNLKLMVYLIAGGVLDALPT